MDMYQKREMRKNKKMDENTKSLPSTSINCLITIYLRTSTNPYFISDYKELDDACFIQKTLKSRKKFEH